MLRANTVSFVPTVGVAPGTTTLNINLSDVGGDLSGALGRLGQQCPPDPVSIAVLPDQSTWAAYKGITSPSIRRWWATTPAVEGQGLACPSCVSPPVSGTGLFGLNASNGKAFFDFVLGLAIGGGLAFVAVKGAHAYHRSRSR